MRTIASKRRFWGALAALVALGVGTMARAEEPEPESFRLWPGTAPGALGTEDADIPMITVYRPDPAEGNGFDAYLHIQNERGVNGVLVEVAGGDDELAHQVALHISFSRPSVLSKDEVPEAEVAAQRDTLENATRNEGKPEAALPKIVEGKLQGWFKRVGQKGDAGGALLEQPWVHDEKLSVTQALGSATIVRFAQVSIGA